MTEIPEHLLKRAAAARAKAAGEPAPADSTPAVAGDAAPAAAPKAAAPVAKAAPAPKPTKVDPPYVTAAKTRRKMPYWAMGALSFMPIWGFMYVRGMQPDIKNEATPLSIGAQIYGGNCSGCHNSDGSGKDGGAVGRPLWNGEVLKTFPRIEDQLNFVVVASDGYAGAPYGSPTRAGGPHLGQSFGVMGARGGATLTDAQVLAAVCHERYGFEGGAKPEDAKYEKEFAEWCAPDGEKWLMLEEEGKTFADPEFKDVGTKPRPAVSK